MKLQGLQFAYGECTNNTLMKYMEPHRNKATQNRANNSFIFMYIYASDFFILVKSTSIYTLLIQISLV